MSSKSCCTSTSCRMKKIVVARSASTRATHRRRVGRAFTATPTSRRVRAGAAREPWRRVPAQKKSIPTYTLHLDRSLSFYETPAERSQGSRHKGIALAHASPHHAVAEYCRTLPHRFSMVPELPHDRPIRCIAASRAAAFAMASGVPCSCCLDPLRCLGPRRALAAAFGVLR